MKLESYLRPIMVEIMDSNPAIGNDAAVAKLRAYVEESGDDGRIEEAVAVGLTDLWRKYVGEANRRGMREIRAIAVRQTSVFDAAALDDMQLPTPDGQHKVTYAQARRADIRAAIILLTNQRGGIDTQINQLNALQEQLDDACQVAQDDITVGEATEQGLIDWNQVGATA